MSFNLLKYFKDTYLDNNSNLKVLNIGYSTENDLSMLFNEGSWDYHILDNVDGKSIDIFVEDIYDWKNVPDKSYDVLICNDFLNNLKYFWLVLGQFEKVMNYGAYFCLIISNDNFNNENYYAFTEKSLKPLIEYVNLNVVEIIKNESNIGVIARKDSEVDSMNYTYSENDVLINNWKEFNSYNSKINESFLKIKSLFSDLNLSNKVYCPICKSKFNAFNPFGVPPRGNAQCQNCGSLERDRFIYAFLEEKTDIFSKNAKILHFNPQNSFINYFKDNIQFDYNISNVKFGWEDDYPNNTFDAVFNFHVMDKIENDIDFFKKMYDVVKPYGDGGFALVNVALLRDKTFENNDYNTPELRLKHYHDKNRYRIYGKDLKDKLELIGFEVEEYTPDMFLDTKLIEIYSILPDSLFLCKK